MTAPKHPLSRRDLLRNGGIALSLAAIVAACGEDRGGDTAPGRVGNADSVEPLADLDVNDIVLLRTASSLELTAVEVYEAAKGIVDFDDGMAALVDRLISNHTATAARMADLTVAAGGTAWNEPNPWIMERAVEPVLATIADSDDVARDVVSFAITLENLAAATHQSLTQALTADGPRVDVAQAAAQEARHSAALALEAFAVPGRFSPALLGDEVTRTADNVLRQFAVTTQFGSVAQIEMIVGRPDVNGTRTTYVLATPAENAFVYEELG